MTTHILGNDLTTLIEQPGSPEVVETEAGYEVTRTYHVRNDLINTLRPAFGSPDAAYTRSYLRYAKKRTFATRDYAELILEYKPITNNDIVDIPAVDTAYIDIDCTVEQIPIEQHPDYSSLTEEQIRKYKSFPVANPVVSRRSIHSTFELSESNIKSNVGTLDSPTGITGCTANKWMKTAQTVRQFGDKYEVVETWNYSDYYLIIA